MDSSDDEPGNFSNANDFFSYEADSRDPLQLSFSKTIKNLSIFETKIEDSGDGSHPDSTLMRQVETQMAPVIQGFLRSGEEIHTKLIKTTVGMYFIVDKIMH
jgi:hypothetical protein